MRRQRSHCKRGSLSKCSNFACCLLNPRCHYPLSQIRTGVRYAFVGLFGGEPSTSKLMPAMERVYPSLEWHCKNVQPQWPLASQEYDCKAFANFFAGERATKSTGAKVHRPPSALVKKCHLSLRLSWSQVMLFGKRFDAQIQLSESVVIGQ